ncbi:MAG TPA: hypothetical protein VK932_23465 [Kofleriaceae bacterium]|nr:hypothetical protein [Kofleriaceae bacterium]
MALRALVALALALALAAGVAAAQPAPALAPSDALREANVAATAGDWGRVAALVEPLVRGSLPPSDLAEAYRLSGMAAFYHQRRDLAEAHFLAYLKIDLDGRLDPALYPPEVVGFFDEVRTKHQAELRARRPKPRSYWLLNLIPPGGQIQNRERGKAWVIGGLLGAFAIGNVTTYLVLHSWCTPVRGDGGSSVICDDGKDRAGSASTLRAINIVSGVGLIATYVYGVYDGARHHRRKESIRPFVAGAAGGGMVGIGGSF